MTRPRDPPTSGTEPSVVCFPFIGHVVGGSHLSTLLLIEGLRAAGVDVRIPLFVDGPVARLLEHHQLPWDLVEVPQAAWRGGLAQQVRVGPRTVPALRRYLDANDVEVVHTNDGRIHRLWGTAALSRRRPWIWHHRTPGLTASMGVLAGRADRVVAVSRYARDRLPAGARRRTVVVDNPFVHAEPAAVVDVRPELQSLLGAADRPLVGFASNMRQARKRPGFFVEVAAGLVEGGVDASSPMVGAVPTDLERALRRLATGRGLDGRLQLLGSRYPIDPWIAACDVGSSPFEDLEMMGHRELVPVRHARTLMGSNGVPAVVAGSRLGDQQGGDTGEDVLGRSVFGLAAVQLPATPLATVETVLRHPPTSMQRTGLQPLRTASNRSILPHAGCVPAAREFCSAQSNGGKPKPCYRY